MARVRMLARLAWRRTLICPELGGGPPDDRGRYPMYFCNRWRWHRGDHVDRDRGVVFARSLFDGDVDA